MTRLAAVSGPGPAVDRGKNLTWRGRSFSVHRWPPGAIEVIGLWPIEGQDHESIVSVQGRVQYLRRPGTVSEIRR